MMTDIIDQGMHTARHFSVRDIALWKLYLIVIGFLLVLAIPAVSSVSRVVYAVVAALCLGYTLYTAFAREGNIYVRIFQPGGFRQHILRHFTMGEVAAFKIGMLALGILLAILFPVVVSLHIAWYVGVAAFGAGYFIALMTH